MQRNWPLFIGVKFDLPLGFKKVSSVLVLKHNIKKNNFLLLIIFFDLRQVLYFLKTHTKACVTFLCVGNSIVPHMGGWGHSGLHTYPKPPRLKSWIECKVTH